MEPSSQEAADVETPTVSLDAVSERRRERGVGERRSAGAVELPAAVGVLEPDVRTTSAGRLSSRVEVCDRAAAEDPGCR